MFLGVLERRREGLPVTPFLDSLNNWPSLRMYWQSRRRIIPHSSVFSGRSHPHVWGSVCQAQCWALGRGVQAPPRRTQWLFIQECLGVTHCSWAGAQGGGLRLHSPVRKSFRMSVSAAQLTFIRQTGADARGCNWPLGLLSGQGRVPALELTFSWRETENR